MSTAAKTAASKPTSVSGEDARRQMADHESELVKTTLAHPLRKGNPFTQDGEQAEPGETIEVSRAALRGLINAGYAAVDREDPAAVEAALAGGPGDPKPDTAKP
jgi:hypothetical protein